LITRDGLQQRVNTSDVLRPKTGEWLKTVCLNLDPLPLTAPYLVAVSGGVDSRVLLYLLLQRGFSKLVVCHFNHRLRGEESEADAHFVRRLAVRAGLPFYSRRAPDWPDQCSLETEARQARHEFLAEAYTSWAAHGVFLGHQANDQVETCLFNLFRGSFSLGNTSMRFRTTIDVHGQKIVILRPLLSVWKKDLYLFAQSLRLRYREDKSNVHNVFSRNKLRNEIIPHIERQFGRDVGPAILRLCLAARDDEELLQALVPAAWRDEWLSVPAVRDLPISVQRRLIYRWLRHQRVSDVGFTHVEAVRSLLSQVSPAKINLPGAKHCHRRSGKLLLS
jgi:tRNA(Ile)-lysidine synthase